MQEKEIFLSLDILAKMGASEKLLEFFKKKYPNDSAPISEVLSDLQKIVSTTTEYIVYSDYIGYAGWLILHFPPTQETLVLDELTEKVIFWNGDIIIKSGIYGERFIIGNGDVNIKGGVYVASYAYILANGNINTIKITADHHAKISAKGNIDVKNITAYGDADISAAETIDAKNVKAYDHSGILANKTIDAKNITAYGDARMSAGTIDAKNVKAYDHSGILAVTIDAKISINGQARIHGEVI